MEVDNKFAAAYEEGRADFLPFVPNDKASTGFLSPFTAGTINGYRVEWDAEVARKQWFSDAPSRLTAVFAFEQWQDCERVSGRYGWPLEEVRRFSIAHALRMRRVNMEIASLARTAYARAMLDADSLDHLWRSYWAGRPGYSIELPTGAGARSSAWTRYGNC